MTFAWPCLLAKNCVDPATKYHGHLFLAHIIAKFAIHKRIVMQVFHSLLKAHAVEARAVVKQALEILTPAMPGRMEDGNVRHEALQCLRMRHYCVDLAAHLPGLPDALLSVISVSLGTLDTLDQEDYCGGGSHCGTAGAHTVSCDIAHQATSPV